MPGTFILDPKTNKILVVKIKGKTIQTNVGVPLGTPMSPSVPSALSVTNSDVNSITIAWHGQSDPSVTFGVQISTDGGATWVPVATQIGTMSFSFTGLNADTVYSFRVNSTNSVGDSDWSSPIAHSTLAPSPTGVATTNITSSSVDLSWASFTDLSITYQPVYSIDGHNWNNFGSPVLNSHVTITGLQSSTQYYFAVRSINSAGIGPLSTSVSATSSAAPVPTLISINPASGNATGGTLLTLIGTGFINGTPQINGINVGVFNVVSDTSITFITPSNVAGAVSITVSNSSGTSNALTYTYQASIAGSVFTTMQLRNGQTAANAAQPVRFGHVFAPGEIPAGTYPEIRSTGSNAPITNFQWDQISRRKDGSWYYAVARAKADGVFTAYQTTGDTLGYDLVARTGTPPYITSTVTPATIAAASQLYFKLYGGDFTAEAGAGDYYYADFNYILANYPRDAWGLNPTGGWELVASGVVGNEYWGWMCIRRHSDNAIHKWVVVAFSVMVWATGEYTINPVVVQPWIYGAHPSGTLGPSVNGQPNVGFPAQPRYAGFYEIWDLKSNTLIGARGGPNDPRKFTIPAANFDLASNWVTIPSAIQSYPNTNPGGGITQSTGWMFSAASGSTLPGGLDPNWVYWANYQHDTHCYFWHERVTSTGFVTYGGPVADTWTANVPISAGTWIAHGNVGFYYLTNGNTGSTPPTFNPLGAGVNPVRTDGTATYIQAGPKFTSQGSGNVNLIPVCATFGNTAIDVKDENGQPYWFDPINHTAAPWMLPMPDFDYVTGKSKIVPPFKYTAPASLGMGEKYFPNEIFVDVGGSAWNICQQPGDDYIDNRLSDWNQRQALRLYQPGDRNTAQDARVMAARFFNYHYWAWDHRTGRIPLINLGHDHAGGDYPGYPTGTINSNLTWYLWYADCVGSPTPMGVGYNNDTTPRVWRHMPGYSNVYGQVVNGSHCPNMSLGDYVINGDYVALQSMQAIHFGCLSYMFAYGRNNPAGAGNPNVVQFPGLGGVVSHDYGQARAAGWDTVKQCTTFIFTPDTHLMKPYYFDNVTDQGLYFGGLKPYLDANVSTKMAQWGLLSLTTASIGGINNLWNLGHMFEGMTYGAMALTPDFPGFKTAVDDFLMNYARIFDPNNGGCLYYVGTAFLVYGTAGNDPSTLHNSFAEMAMSSLNCGNPAVGQQNSFGQTPGGSFVCPGVGQSAPGNTFAVAGRGVQVLPGVNILDGEQVWEDQNFCTGNVKKDATAVPFQNIASIAKAASMPGADPKYAALYNEFWDRIHTGGMTGPTFGNSFMYAYEVKSTGVIVSGTPLLLSNGSTILLSDNSELTT